MLTHADLKKLNDIILNSSDIPQEPFLYREINLGIWWGSVFAINEQIQTLFWEMSNAQSN